MSWLDVAPHGPGGPGPSAEPEVVELTLPLPAAWAAALVREAARRGLTPGQMLRLLIRTFLSREGDSATARS